MRRVDECGSLIKRNLSTAAKYGLGFADVNNQMTEGGRRPGAANKYIGMPKTASIVGAPMTFGQTYVGTDKSPAVLREGGLHSNLKQLNWRIDDSGDLEFADPAPSDPVYEGEGAAHQSFCVGQGNKQISDAVASSLANGHFCLTLGGDHSIGVGTISGVLREYPDAGLIWVDAHADLNTPASSGSGNIHGMPIAFMLENLFKGEEVPGFEWLAGIPKLKPEQVVYIGLRDVDDMERSYICDLDIRAYTMQDVDAHGIGGVVQSAVEYLEGRPLHMSYDIDAIDPDVAPSTGTAVRGGLTYREANYICEAVGDTDCLVALDVVELNVNLEQSSAAMTMDVGQQLIASAMGRRIL